MKNITDKVCRSDQAQRIRLPYWQRGLSLIELIVFIVVMSIAVVAVMQGLSSALRGSLTPGQITQATQLAQERMELILATRQTRGYSGIFDPCTTCTLPGYTVAPFTSEPWPVDTDIAKYLVLVVTVTKTDTGTQVAQYKTLVANY